MEDRSPRRRVDWIYTILGGVIVVMVGFGVRALSEGISEVKKEVGGLRVQVGKLETRIELGMGDRFTGSDGKALAARVGALERAGEIREERLDRVEQFCAEVRGATAR